MKVQVLMPFDPDADQLWAENKILSEMVNFLHLKGVNVASGQKLRIILTMDDGSPSLFLQGEELQRLKQVLELAQHDDACSGSCEACDLSEDCIIETVLARIGP